MYIGAKDTLSVKGFNFLSKIIV